MAARADRHLCGKTHPERSFLKLSSKGSRAVQSFTHHQISDTVTRSVRHSAVAEGDLYSAPATPERPLIRQKRPWLRGDPTTTRVTEAQTCDVLMCHSGMSEAARLRHDRDTARACSSSIEHKEAAGSAR